MVQAGKLLAKTNIAALTLLIVLLDCIYLVNCLYEDQRGKFDWRKQFVGIPSFVYHHPGTENLIVSTQSNVVASIHRRDGSILWRQIMPEGCNLDHMSILKPNDFQREYLVRTSCKTKQGDIMSHIWNPNQGLLVGQEKYKEIVEDDQAESLLADKGHKSGDSTAFTLSDDLTLLVSIDGKVTLRSHETVIWLREEALASISDATIFKLPADMRDRFGLKKRIVVVTESGKLFGLDTITGNIEWDLYDKDISSRDSHGKTKLIVVKQSDDDITQSRALIVHPKGLIVEINPITGQIIDKHTLAAPIIQVAQTKPSEDQGVLILDTDNQVHIYPDSLLPQVVQDIDKYYMVVMDNDKSELLGYRFRLSSEKIKPDMIWNFPINGTRKVLSLSIKRIDEEVHSPARVLGDRGMLYKYLNPNLVAIMTEGTSGSSCSPDHYVDVYLIDGVTGALVHSIHHPKSRGPSKMIHSENWLIYSYHNLKSRRNEISSLEMFEGSTQSNSSAFSSLARGSIKPKLIEQKTFIFPGGIDTMVDTVTLRAMTNRHVIVALPSGGLLEIPRMFLDPRRPYDMLMEHREEGLVPYMPELPIPSESLINYDQTLMAIRNMVSSPASLESTSLLFAYGLDIFFTRVTPSKTFDILKDDFDHLLITIVLVFLVVASYVSKLLAQRKALRAAWK